MNAIPKPTLLDKAKRKLFDLETQAAKNIGKDGIGDAVFGNCLVRVDATKPYSLYLYFLDLPIGRKQLNMVDMLIHLEKQIATKDPQ